RYGRLAEEAAQRRYGLDADHGSWHDARTSDGRPVEVKAAMLNRRDGSEGRFRIFEDYHERLAEERGLYVFVPYRARGRGIQVVDMRSVDAGALRLKFYGAGGHRGSNQVKIHPRRIF
ncbi:hypothetical protein C482_03634, partial [Natrialba chahannaoensis JCM 10990]